MGWMKVLGLTTGGVLVSTSSMISEIGRYTSSGRTARMSGGDEPEEELRFAWQAEQTGRVRESAKGQEDVPDVAAGAARGTELAGGSGWWCPAPGRAGGTV